MKNEIKNKIIIMLNNCITGGKLMDDHMQIIADQHNVKPSDVYKIWLSI